MSQHTIKPIETQYKGYRFRSRLEARWAVFFDTLGIAWEYEKEGYDLGQAGWYLPDFWLPTVNMWAEVKGQAFTEQEKQKCRQLAIQTGYSCLMLNGTPEMKPYWAMEPFTDPNEGPDCIDYALSNYRDYPKTEHRFFVNLGFNEKDPLFRELFSDMEKAVINARSARFEHRHSRPQGKTHIQQLIEKAKARGMGGYDPNKNGDASVCFCYVCTGKGCPDLTPLRCNKALPDDKYCPCVDCHHERGTDDTNETE